MSTTTSRWRTGIPTVLAIGSLLLILFATLTPRGATLVALQPSHFCLWCGPSRATDAIANVVLFVPLGASLVLLGMTVRTAVAVCATLAFGIELTQSMGVPTGRIASASDFLTNSAGAAAGALLATWRHTIAFPRKRAAVALVSGWTIACSALLIATAWAVSAPSPLPSAAAVLPATSALPFTPGFGWYAGEIAGTLVDDVEFPHRGTGPMIVQVPRKTRHIARVAIVGRDARGGLVPILYAHAPNEGAAHYIVAQRGRDALLRGESRAGTLGLAPLDLIVPDAFVERSMGLSDTTLATARVSGRALELTVSRGAERWSGLLLRTPTVGWTLIQSLVGVSSRPAAALTALWLIMLTLPLGYWGWWCRRARAGAIIGSVIIVSACLTTSVRAFGISDPPPWQWYTMLAGIALGMLVAQLLMTRPIERRDNLHA
ncbi:MAG: VanZ family protein [Gemmatimonadota bacterium]